MANINLPVWTFWDTLLSTAALSGQTSKMAQTLVSMFQNVAYRPTVYRTGVALLRFIDIDNTMQLQIVLFNYILYTRKKRRSMSWPNTQCRIQSLIWPTYIQAFKKETVYLIPWFKLPAKLSLFRAACMYTILVGCNHSFWVKSVSKSTRKTW